MSCSACERRRRDLIKKRNEAMKRGHRMRARAIDSVIKTTSLAGRIIKKDASDE